MQKQTIDSYAAGRVSKDFDDCPYISAQEVYREWCLGFVEAHAEAKVIPLNAPLNIQGRIAYRLGHSITDGPSRSASGPWALGWLTEKDNHDAVLRQETGYKPPLDTTMYMAATECLNKLRQRGG